jgi:hypothetical protein
VDTQPGAALQDLGVCRAEGWIAGPQKGRGGDDRPLPRQRPGRAFIVATFTGEASRALQTEDPELSIERRERNAHVARDARAFGARLPAGH